MSCLKTYKTSLGALLLLLMVTDSYMEPPPSQLPSFQEPIIYVTFTRWENRTFSPRVYYILLQSYGLKNKLLGLPPSPSEISGTNNVVEQASPNIEIGSRFGFPSSSSSSKGKLRQPGPGRIDVNKLTQFRDRINHFDKEKVSEVPGIERKDSAVYFPSTHLMAAQGSDDFFADRLAYPGLSNTRPTFKAQTSTTEFSRDQISTIRTIPQTLTEDDVIETNGLTFDIMRVSNWQDENIIFSPLSISNVLAILLLGSGGETFKEIAAQLRRENPLNVMDNAKEIRFHTAFSNLLSLLDSGSNDHVLLETFSHIFVDKKFELAKSFQENAMNFYNARSKVFDFQKDGELFKQRVNEWVAFKTRGKIQTLVDSPPDSSTTLSLVNAVYFQGSWQSPFIQGITQMKPFYVSPTEIMDVPMMTNILTIPYLQEENFRVMGLPYKDNKTGLFVILPKNPGIKGLRQLEQQLTHESLKKLYSMKLTQVTVQMPKMRVESDGHIQEILVKLGMETIFNQKYANFSRISNTSGLYIQSILHRAIMDVNEKGTEAAAATLATGDRNLDDRPVLFAVNRPFIFTIIQIKAQSVLFWGRVTRPQPIPE